VEYDSFRYITDLKIRAIVQTTPLALDVCQTIWVDWFMQFYKELPYTIYVLIDPFTGEYMYVGKTTSRLNVRLKQHIAEAVSHKTKNITAKTKWVRGLLAQGTKPLIADLERVIFEESSQTERTWIALLIQLGAPLLNHQTPSGVPTTVIKLPRKSRKSPEFFRDTEDSYIITHKLVKQLNITANELRKAHAKNQVKCWKFAGVRGDFWSYRDVCNYMLERDKGKKETMWGKKKRTKRV
jgi:hypothetical protein